MADFKALQEDIGYHFKNISLLKTALTHPSYSSEVSSEHYQRLEFLGDAVLQFLVSKSIFAQAPNVQEGKLSTRRAALVREETLASVAQRYKFGDYIRLSHGEENSGGRKKPSILSDVTEAIIAAVYLDGGMDPADQLVQGFLEHDWHTAEKVQVDYKSRLQEQLQALGEEKPTYEIVSEVGPPHNRLFTCSVVSSGKVVGEGTGKSKKQAEQEAAKRALEEYYTIK